MRLTTKQIIAVHGFATRTGDNDLAAITLAELSERGALAPCAEGCGVDVGHSEAETAAVSHVDCDHPEEGAAGPAEGYAPSVGAPTL